MTQTQKRYDQRFEQRAGGTILRERDHGLGSCEYLVRTHETPPRYIVFTQTHDGGEGSYEVTTLGPRWFFRSPSEVRAQLNAGGGLRGDVCAANDTWDTGAQPPEDGRYVARWSVLLHEGVSYDGRFVERLLEVFPDAERIEAQTTHERRADGLVRWWFEVAFALPPERDDFLAPPEEAA